MAFQRLRGAYKSLSFQNKLVDGPAGVLFIEIAEVGGGDEDLPGDLFDRKLLIQMVDDVALRFKDEPPLVVEVVDLLQVLLQKLHDVVLDVVDGEGGIDDLGDETAGGVAAAFQLLVEPQGDGGQFILDLGDVVGRTGDHVVDIRIQKIDGFGGVAAV